MTKCPTFPNELRMHWVNFFLLVEMLVKLPSRACSMFWVMLARAPASCCSLFSRSPAGSVSPSVPGTTFSLRWSRCFSRVNRFYKYTHNMALSCGLLSLNPQRLIWCCQTFASSLIGRLSTRFGSVYGNVDHSSRSTLVRSNTEVAQENS